eukprot:TRINITY_DN17263_c0_g2_i1.p1 TRINITY_DN17263_c0_g2~~TRINITY_DN17263_c0_g2_i1.p1  ORF type:complete len:193 (-),score=45.92 TRINITY_DN17263_c0_g2_i1:35-613(-)
MLLCSQGAGCVGLFVCFFFFFSSRRRHTRCREVSWARRCVQETGTWVLEKIDANFSGKYDFFYLPIDFQNNCNMGYAFINFVNPLYILPFYEEYSGKRWEKFNSEKICQLTYGRIQGKPALEQHFHSSSVMKENVKVRPLLFDIPKPSDAELHDYEQELRKQVTPDKLKKLQDQCLPSKQLLLLFHLSLLRF